MIYKVLTGSRGYGTHHDESDFDYRSVCVMPKDYYLGLKKMEQTNEYGEEDSVIYNIDKFLTLCMSSNPNIIEMLFVEDPISVDHVRNGSLSYDELIKYTESLDKEIKRCYDSSKLPETVDFNKVNDIKIELLERYLYEYT